MQKAHNSTYWENYPSDKTPVNDVNLNKLEAATDEIDNRVITLDATKLDKSTGATMVKDVTYDESTGIFTVQYLNGATYQLDTKLEKLAVNFTYDKETQQLIINLDDGTQQKVDLSALITQYEFLNTDTVVFSINSDGKVSAIVPDGSITEEKLQPNYLADIKIEVSKAQASQKAAADSEANAKASETSAKVSETAAANSAAAASESETNAASSASSAADSANTATIKAEAAATSATNALNSANTASTQATEASMAATAAASSASTASSKASEASESATAAANSAIEAESFTHGDTGSRTGENTDNAKYYYQQSKSISESFAGALRPMGTVAFSSLPPLSDITEGDMYNISDEFTTTADFKEGAGNTIPAGANVYKTADGMWDVLAGTPVTGVKGDNEDSYRRGNVNLTPGNIGALPTEGGTITGDLTVQGALDIMDIDASEGLYFDFSGTSVFAVQKEGGTTSKIYSIRPLNISSDAQANLGNSTYPFTNMYAKKIYGDVSNATAAFSQAASRENLASGENLQTALAKIMKWFADLKDAAFSAVANNLTTTASGSVLDARQGKTLKDSIDTMNTNLNGKATVGEEVGFGGVHIGGDTTAFPYIYSENSNLNFRYKDADGNDGYANMAGINSDLESIKNMCPARLKLSPFNQDDTDTADKFNFLIYNYGEKNFAGIAGDYNGNIIFRTGVGSSNFFIMTNSGIFKAKEIEATGSMRAASMYANYLLPNGNLLSLLGSNDSAIWNNARIEVQSATTANNSQIRMYTGDSAIVYNYNVFYPTLTISLGTASYKWNSLYALNGTIQTSDRNKKKDIEKLDDALIKAFIMGLVPSSYKMLEGSSGRTHYGFIAQDVEGLMESLEMSSMDFAGFIKSPRTEIEEVRDDDGNVVETKQKVIEGEYEYALRYDEFIAPAIRMIQLQQSEIDALKEKNENLQKRMDKLEERLNELEKLL